MAFNFSKYNSEYSNPFGVDTDREYVKLSDLGDGFIFKVDGLFINNKGKYGSHAVLQANIPYPVNISMPNGMTDMFNEILKDNEAVEGIKAGTCFMKVKQYTSKKYGRVCFTADFVKPQKASEMLEQDSDTAQVPF